MTATIQSGLILMGQRPEVDTPYGVNDLPDKDARWAASSIGCDRFGATTDINTMNSSNPGSVSAACAVLKRDRKEVVKNFQTP